MAAFEKLILSGSTNGRMIKVAATSTPGTTIHTAVSGTSNMDEIWLWAVNSSTSEVKLTIEWGGTSSPDDTIELAVPPEDGLYLVAPGLLLQNSLLVRAFAGTADVVMVTGYVHRITA
jgi:hypothetical protein